MLEYLLCLFLFWLCKIRYIGEVVLCKEEYGLCLVLLEADLFLEFINVLLSDIFELFLFIFVAF